MKPSGYLKQHLTSKSMWSVHPDMSPMNLVKRYVANMLLCILKKATSLCTFGVLSALQLFNVPQLQKLRKICMNLQLWPNTSHWLSWNILSWWLDSISSFWACASLLQPIQVRILTNFYCVRGHEALVGCRCYSLLFFHLVPATWEGMFLASLRKTSWDQL